MIAVYSVHATITLWSIIFGMWAMTLAMVCEVSRDMSADNADRFACILMRLAFGNFIVGAIVIGYLVYDQDLSIVSS